VLNNVFVAGLPGLVPVYQQWSVVTFSSVRACFGLLLLCLLSVLSVSRIFFSKLLNPLLFQFISKNSANSLREPYPLNWYKLLINVISSSLNGVTLLVFCHCLQKLFFLHNIIYFCLLTPKMYLKLNIAELK